MSEIQAKLQELELNILALYNTPRANIKADRYSDDMLVICFNYGFVPLTDLLDYITKEGFEYASEISVASHLQRKDSKRTDYVITIKIWLP